MLVDDGRAIWSAQLGQYKGNDFRKTEPTTNCESKKWKMAQVHQ